MRLGAIAIYARGRVNSGLLQDNFQTNSIQLSLNSTLINFNSKSELGTTQLKLVIIIIIYIVYIIYSLSHYFYKNCFEHQIYVGLGQKTSNI